MSFISRLCLLFVLTFLLNQNVDAHYNPNVLEFEQRINDSPDLKQYAQLYNNYRISAAFVASGGAIFAPTDRAFDKKPTRNKNNDIIIPAQLATKEIVDLTKAPKTLDTYGGLPLRLTKFFNPLGNTYEYYINNAKILGEPEVFKKGKVRYQLFTIDELIEPVTYSESRILTAYELINEPSAFDQLRVDLHNVISFATKINKTREIHIFNDPHIQSTFFVPIESLDMFADSRIVNTHVIPNVTLFTRTFSNETYRAAATDWNLCVNISFERERFLGTFDYNVNDDWEGRKVYVKALVERHDHQELLGDGLIEGLTFSEIVLPNVPVKNGVVHFIKQALATPTTFLRDNLIELSKSQLARFYTFIRKYPTIFNLLHQPGEKTIFAFTNDAYDRVAFMLESYNSSHQEEILKLHISLQMNLNSRQMRMGEFRKLTSLSTWQDNVIHATNEDVFNRSVLYVDGQGVKARALEANILGVDGNIHIIDKVLGVAYQTVMEKLQSDPFLWRTYNVSTKQHNIWTENWAIRLNNTHNNAKFTFFVPSENAWKNLEQNYPSYYKQINAGYYIRNTLRILDRHLILTEALSVEDLAKKNEIKTLGGIIKIKTEGAKVFLEWEGIHAHIERPNINAINGVIHAIDRILFKEADMKVSEDEARLSGSMMPCISKLFIFATVIISILLNRLH